MNAADFLHKYEMYGMYRFFTEQERDQIATALRRPLLEPVPTPVAEVGEKLPQGDAVVMGEIEVVEGPGPTLDDMANAAFNAARSSLRRLMPHRYKVVVVVDGIEQRFGLDKWVKLRDGSNDNEAVTKGKKKTPVHKAGLATS